METFNSQKEEAQNGRQDALQQIAAKIIQRAWRRYVCKEVFRHIQKLIHHCNQQDPQTILRTVNPREVAFPPKVYYKIYTYRPIVDLCSSSPRDYYQLGRKKLFVQKSDPAPKRTEESGWYKRVENNNWRLFCCKAVGSNEPIETGVNKKIDFHPSRMQRKQDVSKWKKRKKIEWLKQMYREGRLQAHSDQAHMTTLGGSSAQEVMEATEEKGDDEMLDWDLDELLSWTNSLNFEE